jgi:hypothetical protein
MKEVQINALIWPQLSPQQFSLEYELWGRIARLDMIFKKNRRTIEEPGCAHLRELLSGCVGLQILQLDFGTRGWGSQGNGNIPLRIEHTLVLQTLRCDIWTLRQKISFGVSSTTLSLC